MRTKHMDFEGDTVTLDDVWTTSFKVPKDIMKKLGYKIVFNEQGDGEVQERETKQVRWFGLTLHNGHA